MRNRGAKKNMTLAVDESGAAAIVIAIVFAALCGVMGLAVDVGHMITARAELQRTADAGALAGAGAFVALQQPGAKSNAKLGSRAE